MSARSALPPAGYKRPTDATLDHLVDTGTRGTSGTPGAMDVEGTAGVSVNRGTRGVPGHQEASVTARTGSASGVRGASGTEGTSDTGDIEGDPGTSGIEGNLGTSSDKAEPRDHVKVRRSLAGEMRDAVWFLSEHGRPRVQLGELLDEALQAWLAEAKGKHNGGQNFPKRGRLR